MCAAMCGFGWSEQILGCRIESWVASSSSCCSSVLGGPSSSGGCSLTKHPSIVASEVVIAADILLATVATDFEQIMRLGGIVIIRVILGYSLRKEAKMT